jgi:glycosyltransferase involved in cell wall biosynthesis
MTFSVLMAVYRGDSPPYLKEAILSILNQTLPPDQIVIVGDGPLTPELTSLIDGFTDQYVCIDFVPLEKNVGLGAALNEGLKHCKHDLIGRMDADDICFLDRFSNQVPFMQAHPSVAVSSGAIEEFDDETLEPIAVRSVPLEYGAIVRMARRRNPINHVAAIFRREAVLAVGGYPPLRKAQDYALWSRLIQDGCTMANIPASLVRVRTGHGFLERRGATYLRSEITLLRYQKSIGFLSWKDYLINLAIRITVRLPPAPIKRLLYRLVRS